MRWFVFFLSSVSVCALFGAPVGNPSFPKEIQEGFYIPADYWIDVRAGYEGDFVADGRMKQTQQGQGRVDEFEQNTNSGVVTFNLLDRIDVFALFGSSRVKTEWRFTDSTNTAHLVELETLYNFLWGVGARFLLFEWSCCSLGCGGRYEKSNYDTVWLTSNGVVQGTNNSHLNWRVWQVDLDLSYKIDIFCPYIGIKYSNSAAEIGTFIVPIAANGSGSNHFENRTPVGIFIGCTLSTGKYFMLNLEGRLVDEEAVTISGDFRF